MTLAEALFALAVREMEPIDDIENMLDRNLLRRDTICDWYKLTEEGSKKLDKILSESGFIKENDRLINLAKQMQQAYPKGRMLDRHTGKPTIYHFRCNVSEVAQKLETFFTRYGNYSDEDIINATKRYVASFNGNYQDWGFRILKYFIFKDDVKKGPNGNYVEPVSPLLDFLENKDDEDISNSEHDWTSTLV